MSTKINRNQFHQNYSYFCERLFRDNCTILTRDDALFLVLFIFISFHTNNDAKRIFGGRKIINKNEKNNNTKYRLDAIDSTMTTDFLGEKDFFAFCFHPNPQPKQVVVWR